MSGKKKLIVVVLLLLILVAVAMGLVWHMNHYVMVDFHFYDKDAQMMDFRQEDLSVSQYERLHRQLPDCRILWNVPFQETRYSNDITSLTVTQLSQDDVEQLAYFPELKELHAEEVEDLTAVLTVGKRYPNLKVYYQVTLGGQKYPQDTRLVRLDTVTQADIDMLHALPMLETVALSGLQDVQTAHALQSYCQEHGLTLGIVLGEDVYAQDAQQLEVTGITEEQILLLDLLPQLKSLHLVEPEASAETLLNLRQQRSDLAVTWEKSICGKVYPDTAVDVDISDMEIGSVEEVEQDMAYLPNAKQVFLGFCGLDNEEIAAYRERRQEQYKVVWVVDLAGKMQVRTDITNFMPSRDGWGYVRDGEIDNIRYCIDLICIDIGHMGVKDVSFLETLVNLEYLILAHTEVQYIDAIVNCKKLKFLELDWSCIRDVSPLVHCTALEDLNVGMAWPDITPLLEMTWLKNLYLIKGNNKANFAEHLPNTRVVTSGEYTVSSGWRNLPNYYAMRDILGMPYM